MPTEWPFKSRSDFTDRLIDMNELSGCGTTAATAITGRCFAAAKKSSCSYDTARSLRAAPTSFSGAVGSDGARIETSRPARVKRPLACATYRPTWSGFGVQSSSNVTFRVPAAAGTHPTSSARARDSANLRTHSLRAPRNEQALGQRDRRVEREREHAQDEHGREDARRLERRLSLQDDEAETLGRPRPLGEHRRDGRVRGRDSRAGED